MASAEWHKAKAEEALELAETLSSQMIEAHLSDDDSAEDIFDKTSLAAVVAFGVAIGHALIAQIEIPEEKQ
jgi:hypothetical protein